MNSEPSKHVDGSLFRVLLHSPTDCAKLTSILSLSLSLSRVKQDTAFSLRERDFFLLTLIEKRQWLEIWTWCGPRLSAGTYNAPIRRCEVRGILYFRNEVGQIAFLFKQNFTLILLNTIKFVQRQTTPTCPCKC